MATKPPSNKVALWCAVFLALIFMLQAVRVYQSLPSKYAMKCESHQGNLYCLIAPIPRE